MAEIRFKDNARRNKNKPTTEYATELGDLKYKLRRFYENKRKNGGGDLPYVPRQLDRQISNSPKISRIQNQNVTNPAKVVPNKRGSYDFEMANYSDREKSTSCSTPAIRGRGSNLAKTGGNHSKSFCGASWKQGGSGDLSDTDSSVYFGNYDEFDEENRPLSQVPSGSRGGATTSKVSNGRSSFVRGSGMSNNLLEDEDVELPQKSAKLSKSVSAKKRKSTPLSPITNSKVARITAGSTTIGRQEKSKSSKRRISISSDEE